MTSIARMTRAVIIGFALCAGPAHADTLRPAQMEQLIGNLGADAYATRQAAEEALSDPALLDTIEEDTFFEILNRDDLGPEQRHRLHRIYARWFAALEKAGMGIGFGQTNPDEPIHIDRVTRNFPCARLGILKDDDVIIGVDGVMLEDMQTNIRGRYPAQELLRAAIVSRQPGDTMELTIRRAPQGVLEDLMARIARGDMRVNDLCVSIARHPLSETLTVDVPLGAYKDLNQRALPMPLIESAARYRLERMGVAVRRPRVMLDGQMSDDLWSDFIRKPNRRSHNDLMSADASVDSSVIRQQQKYILRAAQDIRRPVPPQPAAGQDLGIDAPIVVGDAENLTEAEVRLIALQQSAQARVASIAERIAQQERILSDRTRTDREHFLAQGRIRDLRNERNKVITQYKAARQALTRRVDDED